MNRRLRQHTSSATRPLQVSVESHARLARENFIQDTMISPPESSYSRVTFYEFNFVWIMVFSDYNYWLSLWLKMVFRFSLVLSIMGRNDGTYELCRPPDVDTTSTFYGGILWIYRPYSIFQSRCESFPDLEAGCLCWLTCVSIARKQYSDFDIVSVANRMLSMVPHKLLPYGLKWVSICPLLGTFHCNPHWPACGVSPYHPSFSVALNKSLLNMPPITPFLLCARSWLNGLAGCDLQLLSVLKEQLLGWLAESRTSMIPSNHVAFWTQCLVEFIYWFLETLQLSDREDHVINIAPHDPTVPKRFHSLKRFFAQDWGYDPSSLGLTNLLQGFQ